ncbi:hypothetical protein PTSG_11627 [Salpingoeca rosetta]|uniref:Uncharacterized protein n=1 Tax=Salpingoeca rosetta (strain ATCC 50818 / BSB-021) TaxID=946362 RepID=F2TX60_SALR5|nr:uncharacterized protein PTSG_11627 [Salpingoeca rosetta]EGD75969.1 hypothetical protein PTSG_11627 [Salpingoeca rosetta]|eukprot:XP_004998145.1 hypothetical protein PTSG_11627 [Salpingoeca rosetta]
MEMFLKKKKKKEHKKKEHKKQWREAETDGDGANRSKAKKRKAIEPNAAPNNRRQQPQHLETLLEWTQELMHQRGQADVVLSQVSAHLFTSFKGTEHEVKLAAGVLDQLARLQDKDVRQKCRETVPRKVWEHILHATTLCLQNLHALACLPLPLLHPHLDAPVESAIVTAIGMPYAAKPLGIVFSTLAQDHGDPAVQVLEPRILKLLDGSVTVSHHWACRFLESLLRHSLDNIHSPVITERVCRGAVIFAATAAPLPWLITALPLLQSLFTRTAHTPFEASPQGGAQCAASMLQVLIELLHDTHATLAAKVDPETTAIHATQVQIIALLMLLQHAISLTGDATAPTCSLTAWLVAAKCMAHHLAVPLHTTTLHQRGHKRNHGATNTHPTPTNGHEDMTQQQQEQGWEQDTSTSSLSMLFPDLEAAFTACPQMTLEHLEQCVELLIRNRPPPSARTIDSAVICNDLWHALIKLGGRQHSQQSMPASTPFLKATITADCITDGHAALLRQLKLHHPFTIAQWHRLLADTLPRFDLFPQCIWEPLVRHLAVHVARSNPRDGDDNGTDDHHHHQCYQHPRGHLTHPEDSRNAASAWLLVSRMLTAATNVLTANAPPVQPTTSLATSTLMGNSSNLVAAAPTQALHTTMATATSANAALPLSFLQHLELAVSLLPAGIDQAAGDEQLFSSVVDAAVAAVEFACAHVHEDKHGVDITTPFHGSGCLLTHSDCCRQDNSDHNHANHNCHKHKHNCNANHNLNCNNQRSQEHGHRQCVYHFGWAATAVGVAAARMCASHLCSAAEGRL